MFEHGSIYLNALGWEGFFNRLLAAGPAPYRQDPFKPYEKSKRLFCGRVILLIFTFLWMPGCSEGDKNEQIWERGFSMEGGEYLQFFVDDERLGSGIKGFKLLLEETDSYPAGAQIAIFPVDKSDYWIEIDQSDGSILSLEDEELFGERFASVAKRKGFRLTFSDPRKQQ